MNEIIGIVVNGKDEHVQRGVTVAELLELHKFPTSGVAVAVDGALVPRSQWHTQLAEGCRVEIVTAVQGG
ncbi:MAG: sulfur carrier protein ThiS [Mycobacteriaceae bacterium]